MDVNLDIKQENVSDTEISTPLTMDVVKHENVGGMDVKFEIKREDVSDTEISTPQPVVTSRSDEWLALANPEEDLLSAVNAISKKINKTERATIVVSPESVQIVRSTPSAYADIENLDISTMVTGEVVVRIPESEQFVMHDQRLLRVSDLRSEGLVLRVPFDQYDEQYKNGALCRHSYRERKQPDAYVASTPKEHAKRKSKGSNQKSDQMKRMSSPYDVGTVSIGHENDSPFATPTGKAGSKSKGNSLSSSAQKSGRKRAVMIKLPQRQKYLENKARILGPVQLLMPVPFTPEEIANNVVPRRSIVRVPASVKIIPFEKLDSYNQPIKFGIDSGEGFLIDYASMGNLDLVPYDEIKSHHGTYNVLQVDDVKHLCRVMLKDCDEPIHAEQEMDHNVDTDTKVEMISTEELGLIKQADDFNDVEFKHSETFTSGSDTFIILPSDGEDNKENILVDDSANEIAFGNDGDDYKENIVGVDSANKIAFGNDGDDYKENIVEVDSSDKITFGTADMAEHPKEDNQIKNSIQAMMQILRGNSENVPSEGNKYDLEEDDGYVMVVDAASLDEVADIFQL